MLLQDAIINDLLRNIEVKKKTILFTKLEELGIEVPTLGGNVRFPRLVMEKVKSKTFPHEDIEKYYADNGTDMGVFVVAFRITYDSPSFNGGGVLDFKISTGITITTILKEEYVV